MAAPGAYQPTTLSPFLALPSPTLQVGYPRRILPIPPAPTIFDQRVIDVGAIGQDHVSRGAFVLVVTIGLECDFFTEGEDCDGVLGSPKNPFHISSSNLSYFDQITIPAEA
jgi:hypothetical protein